MPRQKGLYRQLKAFSIILPLTSNLKHAARGVTMKRALALAFSTLAVVAGMSGAKADWSVGAGFENFRWKESTSPSVKESGLRWALDLAWMQSREPGLSAA